MIRGGIFVHADEFHVDRAAIAAARNALSLKRNYMRAEVILRSAEEQKGNFDAALTHFEHVLAANTTERRALPADGYLLARRVKRNAEQIAAQLEHTNATLRNCPFQVAVVYAGLGRRDQALEWLERAWSSHQVHFPFARVEGRFREMRDDPRFRALLAKVT
jgi:tetratricopeptide (TPR) repeat protein